MQAEDLVVTERQAKTRARVVDCEHMVERVCVKKGMPYKRARSPSPEPSPPPERGPKPYDDDDVFYLFLLMPFICSPAERLQGLR
jgi:hypothetical protein